MSVVSKLSSWFGFNGNCRDDFLGLLNGEGLEIGALHRPVNAPHLSVKYVDRLPVAELLKQYPELAKEKIVEPDVLDDGETLGTIPSASQDFVIANHVIEHMSNPIGTLLNWQRVLKPGGRLFLAAPDKRYTFDIERELTPIEHLMADYENPSAERDKEAFFDFALKVSCRKFGLRPESQASELAKELWDTKYSIHYHVWTFQTFGEFLKYLDKKIFGWQMHVIEEMPTQKEEFIFVLEKA